MRGTASGSPFSWRGVAVGAILSFVVGAGVPYAVLHVGGADLARNSSLPAAIVLLFVLAIGVNLLLGVVRRRLALSKADLVMAYVMALMATTVPTQAFVGCLIPVISGLVYYATPENKWLDTFGIHTPEWLAPHDFRIVRDLHEGLPEGVPIPWEVWVTHLGAWYAFFMALSVMMICLSSILHRQWSLHERLAYPMVQLPLQMIEGTGASGRLLSPFFRSKIMWMGFLLPVLLLSLSGLSTYFPFIPSVPYYFSVIRFFRDAVYVPFWFDLAWMGFFYLVSLEILFSIWFFYLFGKLQEGLFTTIGVDSTEQLSLYSFSQTADLTHQQMGACIVFVVFTLWAGRRHLCDVWRRAWHRDPGVDDSQELLSYRTAVVGFLGSLLLVAAWLWYSGIPLIVLPLFLVACLIFYIMVTRVVATAGVPTVRSPMVAAFFVISTLGTSVIGARGLVALTFTWVWQSEMRVFPMIACANALKLAESISGSKTRLFWGMIVALVFSLAGATWIILYLCYEHGGINLNSFFMTRQAIRTFTDMARPLMNPTLPDVRGMVFTGIGGLIEAVLMIGQYRFHWWPLHPVGYVISVGWLTSHIWFVVLVTWLLKLTILRYGGPSLFRTLRPFFLGLILGEATIAATWIVIYSLIDPGIRGHTISIM
jgi:hypothetical protein